MGNLRHNGSRREVAVAGQENNELQQVHDHIFSKPGHSSRTDTIFVVTAVLFILIVLGVNSGVSAAAAEEDVTAATDLILAVFIAMTLLVNFISVAALVLGRRTRAMLLNGLVSMYEDNEVNKYYDPALVSNFGVRYSLFAGVSITLAVTAIVVARIIRFL